MIAILIGQFVFKSIPKARNFMEPLECVAGIELKINLRTVLEPPLIYNILVF